MWENNSNLQKIKEYYYNNIDSAAYQNLDDKISDDLDLDDLFVQIDRTASKVGQQYLYAKLRTIPQPEEHDEFRSLVDDIRSKPALQRQCRKELNKLQKEESYNIHELLNSQPPLFLSNTILLLLNSLTVIFVILAIAFDVKFLIGTLPILCFNIAVFYKSKIHVLYYISAIRELWQCVNAASYIHHAVQEHDSVYIKRNVSFITPLKKMVKYIRYITLDSWMNGYLLGDLMAALLSFFDLIRALLNIDLFIYNKLADSLAVNQKHIHAMFEYVGNFDTALSVAELLNTTPTICRPEFCDRKSIDAENIYHPLIPSCVPNSFCVKDHSMLFIGSNMSGKTTFMRTIGINAVLGQCFSFCFAEKYSAPYFKIATSIRITDSLKEKTSYYQEEVLSIRKFTQNCQTDTPFLFVIDEIFKGTNTKERIAIAKAVLLFLNTNKDFVLVTTHDLELVTLLADKYIPYYFEEEFSNGTLTFKYILHEGDNPSQNAIELLKANGYPNRVIETAIDEYNSLINNKKI